MSSAVMPLFSSNGRIADTPRSEEAKPSPFKILRSLIPVLEVIHSFESVTQVQLNYKLTDRRAGDIASLYAATEQAEKKLGWKAQKDLDEMMRSSWDWEQHYRSQQ